MQTEEQSRSGGKSKDAEEQRSWSFDVQHLATAGPAGLRLGMLSPLAPEKLK
jgi:hypothetical protein